MGSRVDIVVFGATGFTGQRTLPFVHKFAKANRRNLTWGVAGRSYQKLKNVVFETAKNIGVDNLNSVPIIIADIDDEESIKKMTVQAKIVINCCGPYYLIGEVVVKSCIETGTHYVDASGEFIFSKDMELKYQKAAEDKGVYIVCSCAVVSIPADLGLVFIENNFKGTLNSVNLYLRYDEKNCSDPGGRFHCGTWESIIMTLKDIPKVLSMRNKMFLNTFPKLLPQVSPRFLFWKESNEWAVHYDIQDKDMLLRSQRYFHDHEGKRPIQVNCYTIIKSFKNVLLAVFLMFLILILCQFRFGRKLLRQYPMFFSGGFFSLEDPSETVLGCQSFSYTLEGLGWSEKLADGEDQYKTKPNKAIVGRVSGDNPAYGFTCITLALSAVVILTEPKKLPAKGGVYSPGAVFSKTSLIKQLQENGAVFEILSTNDVKT